MPACARSGSGARGGGGGKSIANPKAFVEAEALYAKHLWVDAEKAFTRYAASAKNDKTKYESVFKSAVCMVQRGEQSKAQSTLSRFVTDSSALQAAPDIVAKACSELHGIYLKQRNATPQRERLVLDCVKRLPGDPVIIGVCEAEAVFWLKGGNVDKVRTYYGLCGSGISKTGGSIVELLSASQCAPISDKELRVLSDVSKALPDASEALFSQLAKRADGWKADYCKALFLADSGKADAAVSVLDTMIRSRRGPEDRIRLAKAETLAFKSSRPKDALKEYRDWLLRNPSSDLREMAEFQYGLLLCNCGMYAEAIAQLEAFAVQYPSGTYAKLAATTLVTAKAAKDGVVKREAESVAKQERHDADPLLPRLEKGTKLQSEGKFTLAAKEYQAFRGQANHAKWGKAWYNLGTCLRQSGDPVRAIATWDEVWNRSQLFTNTLCGVESRLAAGDAHLEDAADAAAALRCYDDAVSARPALATDSMLEMNRAICLLALGRTDEARAFFLKQRNAAGEGTFLAHYWNRLAALCDGSPYQLIRTTVALDRKAAARMFLGDTYFAAGENRKAPKQYELAAKLISDPELAAYCLLQTARCTAKLGKSDAALSEYGKILVKYPHSSLADDALLLSGVLWAGPKDNWKEAVKCFEQILREYPHGNHVEGALYYLATLTRWNKKNSEAERFYDIFLKRFPASQLCATITDVYLPQVKSRDR